MSILSKIKLYTCVMIKSYDKNCQSTDVI